MIFRTWCFNERKTKTESASSYTVIPILGLDNGDLSEFLPTNLVIITDSQAILSQDLFNNVVRPALDTGLYVSRLMQPRVLQAVSSRFKITLTQLKSPKKLVDITTDLSDEILLQLMRGKNVCAYSR